MSNSDVKGVDTMIRVGLIILTICTVISLLLASCTTQYRSVPKFIPSDDTQPTQIQMYNE